jgi:hypothetical protein
MLPLRVATRIICSYQLTQREWKMSTFKADYKKLSAIKLLKGHEIAKLQETYDYAEHVLKGIVGDTINWSADDYDDQTGDLINALDNMMSASKDTIAKA